MSTRRMVAIGLGLLLFVVAAMPVSIGAPPLGGGAVSGLTPEEARVLRGLDYGNAWAQLEYLSGLGEKTAGSAEERAAQQYVYDEFAAMGLDEIWWETFPVANWKHYGTTVKIASHGDEEVPATVYGDTYSIWGRVDHAPYSFGNANGGRTLVADVVDVGLGTAADFATVGDLQGAIALVHRDDNVQGWPNTPAEEAGLHGASAVLFYGYYDGYDNPEGLKQDSVFSPVPAISISPRSAQHIQDLLEAGPVTLEIEGRVDTLSEKFSESVNVAGILRGTTRADEYVVISGHIDTWWAGSNDDCSSIAVVLELARLFSEARTLGTFVNERTLVFMSVGAEETGGPGGTWYNWLVGSYEFVLAHPDVLAGLVVELNLDGVSFRKTSGRYWVENTWEVNPFVAEAIGDLGLTGAVAYYNPVWSWTDAWSFAAKGGGSAIQMMWIQGFDSYYHTQLDTIDVQSPDTVQLVLRLNALLAIRGVHALVVPLDFQPTVDWAASYLRSERMTVPAAAGDIDAALAALATLRSRVVAANAYAADVSARYARATTPDEEAAILAEADALNGALIDARRIITPWTLGEGGLMGSWDVFLRSDQHAHDYGFVSSAITALHRNRIGSALVALEGVYTMEWGRHFSRHTYLTLFDGMLNTYMYWGDDFDQQQAYVDVQGIYLGLKDGSVSKAAALADLTWIRDAQLLPWFQEDLRTLVWAWSRAAAVLDAALP